MDISDIVITEFLEVDINDQLGKIRAIFDEENPKAIIVMEDGDYQGVVTQKRLVGSHIEDQTKVSAVMQSAPRINRREDIRDVARKLVEGGSKAAPVFENNNLYGIITEDAILAAILDSLDALRVDDVATTEVISVTEEDDIGRVINQMREHGISRLPVVNENRYLVGIVTTYDIIEFVTRNEQRTTTGDRVGDSARMLDLPAYDVMTSPVETTTLGTNLEPVVQTMLDNDFSGLMVTPSGDERSIAGVVTKTDVLRALSIREEDHLDVQITNIDLLDTIDRQEIRQSIEESTDKYRDMQVHHAHVRFHKHKEKLRGTPLIQSQIRLRTNQGQVAGSGEGYGAENAFFVAIDKLERNILELKGITHDKEYQGQLLRKLGEL